MQTIKLHSKTHNISLHGRGNSIRLTHIGRPGVKGDKGDKGDRGDPATNLVQSVNGKQGVVVLNKTDIGLSDVDNTSDLNKPISNATQSALDTKAPMKYMGPVTGQESVHETFLRQERIIDPNVYTGSTGVRCVIPTHDPVSLDGELTHPSVVYTPEKWNGYYYWMGVTPYLNSNDSYEDPCIVASNDGVNWVVPAGLTNPLDDAPGGTKYNSDTHLVFGPNNVLYLFWRYLDISGDSPGAEENIYVRTSTDGITWTPKQLVHQTDQTVRRLLSPSFEYYEGKWHMFAVDIVGTKRVVYTTSTTLTPGSWTTPVNCTVSLPSGRYPWHLFVARVGDQWVGLLNDSSNSGNSGQDGDLILMTSSIDDGLTWNVASRPAVPRSGTNFTRQYRSCFVAKVVDGVWGFDLWHSVWNPKHIYRTSLTLLDYRPQSDVQFARLGLGGAAGTRPLRITAAAPEMEFIESDNSNKTWHMGVNAGIFKVTETGVQDKLLINQANQAYGLRYNDTNAGSSGNYEAFLLNPTISHTGTRSYTGLYVNVSESSVGSGTKLLLRAGVNGSSKFTVDNAGAVTALSYAGSGAGLTNIPQSAIVGLPGSISGLVPYTGATTDLNLGSHNLQVTNVLAGAVFADNYWMQTNDTEVYLGAGLGGENPGAHVHLNAGDDLDDGSTGNGNVYLRVGSNATNSTAGSVTMLAPTVGWGATFDFSQTGGVQTIYLPGQTINLNDVALIPGKADDNRTVHTDTDENIGGEKTFLNTVRVINDTSMTFEATGGGNNNSFKTGTDGTFLFDVGAGNSVKIKGGDDAGAETFGYTDTSFNYVWKSDTLGNTTQSGTATVATPTLGGHATTKTYVDTATADKVSKAGDTMTGALVNTLATGNSLIWDTNSLVVDAGNHRVGIGTNTPLVKLHVLNSGATSGIGSTPGNRGMAITGGSGSTRLYMESTDSTSGRRLMAFDKSSGNIRIATFNNDGSSITTDNIMVFGYDGQIGVGTAAPTHTLTFGSTGTGISSYNTADQSTNFERAVHAWSSNTYRVQTGNGGTGIVRPIYLGSANVGVTFDTNASNNRGVFAIGTTNGSTGSSETHTLTTTAASGSMAHMAILTTVNQSSTAGYTSLLINATETATGSGNKYLVDFQVGGSSKATVNNAGDFYTTGAVKASGAYPAVPTGDGVYLGTPAGLNPRFSMVNGTQVSAIDTDAGGMIRFLRSNVSIAIGYLNGNGLILGSGLGSLAPTHSLTLPSISTGAAFYNTADQTTNYERVRMFWSTNTFYIGGDFGGTGTSRTIRISPFGTSATGGFQVNASSLAGFAHSFGSSTAASAVIHMVNGTLSASTGVQYGLNLSPTINQTSTAGYTAILANITETGTGSGAKNLLDLQVGGSTKFKVDNAGRLNMASSTAPASPTNGDIWFDGTDLKMRIGGVTKTFTMV